MKLQLALASSAAALVPALIYFLINYFLATSGEGKGPCEDNLKQYGQILIVMFIISAVILFLIGWSAGGVLENTVGGEVNRGNVLAAITGNTLLVGLLSIILFAMFIVQLYGIYLLFNKDGRQCAKDMNKLWIAYFAIFALSILSSLFGGSE